jgi:hypothetical protein
MRLAELRTTLVLVALAAAANAQVGTAKLTATFAHGTVTSLTNTVTGEATARPSHAAASLLRIGLPDLLADADETVWHEANGAEAARMSSALTTDDASGDLILTQSAAAPGKRVRGVSWVLDEVPDSLQVIVPGNSGQCFDRDSPADRRVFDYPMGWEAQFVLLQGAAGGVLVYAEDQAFGFKALAVEHVTGKFRLTFSSYADAPFESSDHLAPPPWRLHAYQGPWQAGVAAYQSWATARFPAAFPTLRQPAWTKDIRFVALVGNETPILAALAKAVDPKQTLLYNPGWRSHEYDRMYPDYEADPAFGAFLAEAHRLGFHVMVHVNHFGCDPKHPLYADFRDHQMRDAMSGEPLWWEWTRAEPPIKFAYINCAYAPWRKLFVDRMKEVCTKYNVDAFHLDQTLCIFNDKNGLIDGVNAMQGNLLLHQELRQALPGVALSGEGLDEITARYEAFAQRHVTGVDFISGTWDDAALRLAHPVSSMVLLPQTTMYGYLGLPNPQHQPGPYCAWRRAYERFGVIPTFAWPDAAQLTGGNAIVEGLLAEARLWTTAKPAPDFAAAWRPEELFVYRTADGRRLSYVRDQGVALRLDDVVVARRIEGVREAKVPGSLPQWPVYDADRILGLDPLASYGWSSRPRDMKQIHLESLSPGLTLARSGRHDDMARFVFAPEPPERRADTLKLWQFTGPARSGVVFKDGTTRAYDGVGFSDEDSNGNAHRQGQGLFIHPPWKGEGLPGSSFVECTVHLPAGPRVLFACDVHLNTGAEGKSDGVVFRVEVKAGGKVLATEALYAKEALRPMELDLSELAGLDATVRLTSGTAPTGNPGFDWALFEHPMIYADTAAGPGRVTIAGLAAADRLLTGAGGVDGPLRDGRAVVDVPCPGELLVMKEAPVVAQAPADLLALPFHVHSAGQDGVETGQPIYPTSVGTATCTLVTRRSLDEHPPDHGRTFVDYWLRLPNQPVKLLTAVGIRDGSKSTGVAFEVEVDGKLMVRHESLPNQGWHPVSVDLAPYAGKDVLLTLVTDSMGPYDYDWASWATPRLEVPAPAQ